MRGFLTIILAGNVPPGWRDEKEGSYNALSLCRDHTSIT